MRERKRDRENMRLERETRQFSKVTFMTRSTSVYTILTHVSLYL